MDTENLAYRTNQYTYSFKTFSAINTFGRDIYNGTITLKGTDKDLNFEFKKKIKSQNPDKKQKKKDVFKKSYTLFDGR